MITIKGITTLDGVRIDKILPSSEERTIDASGLTLMPTLIDPHVHLRTPGLEHKEDWTTGAAAALRGGINCVFDMPNTLPATTTLQRLQEKCTKIEAQLREAAMPLRYYLYLGADKSHFDEIYKARGQIIGLKVFMGSSTGGLVMDDDSSLHAAFALAAAHDLVLAVHAEDEHQIQQRGALFARGDVALHSQIRNAEVAARAVQRAIDLARIYRTRLYILHVSSREELACIRLAKREGLCVYAEATPHHLFLTTDAYATLGTRAQVNPPLRSQEDCDALWQAIEEGIIDTIGSDHAPHLLDEKARPYPDSPSGMPGLETTLPLLLDAHHKGRLTLQKILWLTRERIEEIFRLPPNDDSLLVDLNRIATVGERGLRTKCGWSPYAGWTLQGWPTHAIIEGRLYEC